MATGESVLRFEGVSFEYGPKKPILKEVDFSIRRGTKTTIMGQNGAGKSTLFQLILGELKQTEGIINKNKDLSIAISKQVIPREYLDLTIRDFFQKSFAQKIYAIDPMIEKVLDVVNLQAPLERIVRSFSGGQQARLLLASALIQDPDILLLDEPTNNLDKTGIEHLTDFLVKYEKTCIVISHDADFLNAFSDGVLYLDVHTKKIEQYSGNYNAVLREIAARIERENRKNAQLAKEMQANKDKVNFFAMKGGQMRLVAKKMREKVEEMEEEIVDVRKEDKPIRPFTIPCQEDVSGEILSITSLSVMKNHKPVEKKVARSLRRNQHLLLTGPNGIGKTTLLESLAHGTAKGAKIGKDVKVGYYRQDFSNLNFDQTARECLLEAMKEANEQAMRGLAAGFQITGDVINTKIGSLSEGQKGLLAFARLVLEEPGLLILDEPTNHINFRHLPVIAKALDTYQGAMILVSHSHDFVNQIRIDDILDLEK